MCTEHPILENCVLLAKFDSKLNFNTFWFNTLNFDYVIHH